MISEVCRSAAQFEKLTEQNLQSVANDLRESFYVGRREGTALEAKGFALSVEAIRRTLGVRLYDVQLVAASILASNNVAVMATGEGKTLAAAPAAILGALRGQAVHISTPNAYLAERDFRELSPAFQLLGISIGLLPDEPGCDEQKRAAYACEATYGTGYEFGFDYLRDQLPATHSSSRQLGSDLLRQLRGESDVDSKVQRGHRLAIVDEIDNVLLDEAGTPLVIAQADHGVAGDADAVTEARKVINCLQADLHYRLNQGVMDLTEAGKARIHEGTVPIPTEQLVRPWTEYVQQAIRAERVYRRDVDYLVAENEVRIIDRSTGRVFADRSWSDGLHQAIEAKEGLKITPERAVLAQVTRQRYYKMYEHLSGMTGTADGCEAEFRKNYGMQVRRVPLRVPSRRRMLPMRGFVGSAEKWDAIVEETRIQNRSGRPVLIGTRSIAESERIADLLRPENIDFQLLNGVQDASEAAIIAGAGARGVVTIATNLAGRGTDIRLSPEAKDAGGLHVIVSEPNDLTRIDRQLIGRCARQGDPGSARIFVSVDDVLIQNEGRWLIRPMTQFAKNSSEIPIDMAKRVRSIQKNVARRQASARILMMRRDLARNSLISPMP